MQLILVAVAPHGDVHVFGSVLRGARAQAVRAQREVVIAAFVVVVFAAGVQLAEHQFPVEALFGGVPIQRAAAAIVLHLDGAVGESGERDKVAISLARLVNRVRQDLEGGVRAAVQTVGAENNRRAQTNALLVLQLPNTVVAVIGRAFCHAHSFDAGISRTACRPFGCRLLPAAARRRQGWPHCKMLPPGQNCRRPFSKSKTLTRCFAAQKYVHSKTTKQTFADHPNRRNPASPVSLKPRPQAAHKEGSPAPRKYPISSAPSDSVPTELTAHQKFA